MKNLVLLGAILTLGASSAAVIGVNQINSNSSNNVLHVNENIKLATKEDVENDSHIVNEEEWKDLLTTSNNYTYCKNLQVLGISNPLNFVVDDNKIYGYDCYNSIEDGKYYYYSKTSNNKWIKEKSSGSSFEEANKLKFFADYYQAFTYDANTNEYSLSSLKKAKNGQDIEGYSMSDFTNIKISFDNKKIKNVKFDIVPLDSSIDLKESYDYSKFNESKVVLPLGATFSSNEVTEEKWIEKFKEAKSYTVIIEENNKNHPDTEYQVEGYKLSKRIKLNDDYITVYYTIIDGKYYAYLQFLDKVVKEEINKQSYDLEFYKASLFKNLADKMNAFKFDGNLQKYVTDEIDVKVNDKQYTLKDVKVSFECDLFTGVNYELFDNDSNEGNVRVSSIGYTYVTIPEATDVI